MFSIPDFLQKILDSTTAKFIALKMVLVTLVTVTLPLILHNFVGWFLTNFRAVVDSGLDLLPPLPPMAYEFTGLAGYLAQQLRIIDCVAVLLAALAINFTLRFIPFF